jgi:hypothetical protein
MVLARAEAVMARKRMLGTELYLFDDGTDVPAPHLIISSHGGYVSRPETDKENEGGGWMKVPAGMELFFYAPHKRPLRDPTVDGLLKNTPYERKAAGELVRNYRLTKFQGRHGSKTETYAALLAGIVANRTLAESQETLLRDLGLDLGVAMDTDQRMEAYRARLENLPPPDQQRLTMAFGGRRIERYDVVTIRNRTIDARSFLNLGITLRTVLGLLPPGAYHKIHCNFCRSSVFMPFARGYDANPGTDWDRRPDGSRRPPASST